MIISFWLSVKTGMRKMGMRRIRVRVWEIEVGMRRIRVGMRGIGIGNKGNHGENLRIGAEMIN